MSRIHTPLTGELSAYLREVVVREPEALRRLRESTEEHPCASMQTAPEQGQFLNLMVRVLGAKNTLEVGVFMGYSSTWVALALPPGGKITACDVNEEYAARARRTWEEAGVTDRIELHLGPAVGTLDRLIAEGRQGSFDFAFIDADKANYDNYYERALQLIRKGGLIAIDNVFWDASVIDPSDQTADTESIRKLNRKLHDDARIALSIVPLGDGLTLACKL